MKQYATLCAMTAMVLFATACNQSVDREAEAKAIQTNEAQWVQDFASKDPEKIVAHYTDDATLMTPGSPASSGKDAIRNGIKQMVADPAMSLKFQSSRVEVAKSGDVAYTQGTYTLTMTDPQTKQVINDHGSYVTTYRKEPDGTWKCVSDIATSEVPPPPPPPAPEPSKPAKHK